MINIEFGNNKLTLKCLAQNQDEIDIELNIKSHGITANYSILIDKVYLTTCLQTLQLMQKTLKGEAELRQRWEENYIAFAGDGLGHVIVSGAHTDFKNKGNECRYQFSLDQTVLPEIINGLNELNC